MSAQVLDPRVTPLRDGIASRALEGQVRAEVYLDPKPMTCAIRSQVAAVKLICRSILLVE